MEDDNVDDTILLLLSDSIAVDSNHLMTTAFISRIHINSPLRTQFNIAVGPRSPLLASRDSFSIYQSTANNRITAVALELPEWGVLSVRGEDRLKVVLFFSPLEESLPPFTISSTLIFIGSLFVLEF